MRDIGIQREPWGEVLKREKFLPLPAAHDALTARLIQQAGFKAYQIGGFALVGAIHAVPDIDLEHFGEISQMVSNIIPASPLPALVDGDDGYGDEKNVTRTVKGYEALGASALFLEDQKAPKRCGHMAGKHVIPVEEMVKKVKAAVAARASREFFLLARTDALAPHGLDDALMRAEQYLKAGADGVYFEGPTTVEELERIGKEFGNVPLATSVLERGGKTPWVPFDHFQKMGFSMVLFPSTIIFQVTKCVQRAVENLAQGKQIRAADGLTMDEFEEVLDLGYWKRVEAGEQHPG